MKKRILYLTLLVWTLFALPMQAQTMSPQEGLTIDSAVVPGVEYLLYNVGSGLYLSKTGTMVANAADADAWRFLSTETTTFIHSEQIFVYMKNTGFSGWYICFSNMAQTQEIYPSTTTPGAIKISCPFMLDRRYLSVKSKDYSLSCEKNQDEWNDWQLVRAPQQDMHLYRLLTIKTDNSKVQYTIGYQSIDLSGNPIELSGYIVVPTTSEGTCTADHVLFSTHYTMTKNSEVPSQSNPFDALTFTMSGNRPVMIEPDYLGYGLTADKGHPYLAPDFMARNCVDMLIACHQLLRQMNSFDVSQGEYPTYGIGYSQGGSIILAVQKFIENNPYVSDSLRNVINYVRTCSGAGPYNPLATISQYVYQDDLTMPCAAPLLVSGVVDAYPEIFETTTAEDYFSEAFNQADIIGKMRSRNYTIDELNAAIKSACGQNKMSLMLSDEALNFNSDLIQKLLKALGQCNLTRDWIPQAEIWFFHNTADDVVPYLNTMSAYNAFIEAGCTNVSLYTTGIGMSHTAAAVDFMARMILGNYK